MPTCLPLFVSSSRLELSTSRRLVDDASSPGRRINFNRSIGSSGTAVVDIPHGRCESAADTHLVLAQSHLRAKLSGRTSESFRPPTWTFQQQQQLMPAKDEARTGLMHCESCPTVASSLHRIIVTANQCRQMEGAWRRTKDAPGSESLHAWPLRRLAAQASGT